MDNGGMSESESRYYNDKFTNEHIKYLEKENKLLKQKLSFIEDKFEEIKCERYASRTEIHPEQLIDNKFKEYVEKRADIDLGKQVIDYIKKNSSKQFTVKLEQYYTDINRYGLIEYRSEMKLIEIDVFKK